MTIDDVMMDDSADIKVVAENTGGEAESSCRLEVKGMLDCKVLFYEAMYHVKALHRKIQYFFFDTLVNHYK